MNSLLIFMVPSISPSHALTQVSEYCHSGSWQAPGFHRITLEALLAQVTLRFRKHYEFVISLDVIFPLGGHSSGLTIPIQKQNLFLCEYSEYWKTKIEIYIYLHINYI